MSHCLLLLMVAAAACSGTTRHGVDGFGIDGFLGNGTDPDLSNPAYDFAGQGNQQGCAGQANGCYAVYAHSDHVLYYIDLSMKTLVTVGPFNAPLVPSGTKMVEDTITDLAVAPDGTIYVVSKSQLYRADATTGHVTAVGPVALCGADNIALSFTPDGSLYVADHKGAFCKIDLGTNPPAVSQIGTIGNGMALSGDIVTIADGTMYGTAYKLSDNASSGTQINNLLVKIDPTTGASTQVIGSTGFPKLFGAAYALGQVFGFTHDGSGAVVTIDPKTGAGTAFNTFNDPATGKGIAFAGAGVNSLVPAIP